MTDPNRLSNGMLVTGDSTVDWTIASRKDDRVSDRITVRMDYVRRTGRVQHRRWGSVGFRNFASSQPSQR